MNRDSENTWQSPNEKHQGWKLGSVTPSPSIKTANKYTALQTDIGYQTQLESLGKTQNSPSGLPKKKRIKNTTALQDEFQYNMDMAQHRMDNDKPNMGSM